MPRHPAFCRLKAALPGFARRDEGAISTFGIFVFLTGATVCAIAVDVARLRAAQSQLQVAADVAAHSALFYRATNSEAEAKAKAIEMMQFGMPETVFGEVLAPEDISFGHWSDSEQSFSPAPGATAAVQVSAGRLASRNNSLATTLFNLVGVPSFDLTASAVFVSYTPACLREGFIAEEIVDMQSNNNFFNGFCIHANGHVELNNNTYFESGTTVSMPDLDDLVLPNSGFSKNEGLEAALKTASYKLGIIDELPGIIEGLRNGEGSHLPGLHHQRIGDFALGQEI